MDIQYLPPILFNNKSSFLIRHPETIVLLAIDPEKHFIVVRDLYYPHIWKSFWRDVRSGISIEDIEIVNEEGDDPEKISQIAEELINGLNYIIANNLILVGFLYIGGNVYDENIVSEGIFFKRSMRAFYNMHINYRKSSLSLDLKEDGKVSSQFIGQGERFFAMETLDKEKIAKMTGLFKGSMCGVVGIHNEKLEFVILSHNITKEKQLGPLKFDKKGRDVLRGLVKTKKFFPIAGFRFDFGVESIKLLPQWGSIELLPEYQEKVKKYIEYHQRVINKQDNPFQASSEIDVFSEKIDLETLKQSVEKPPEKPSIKGDSVPTPSLPKVKASLPKVSLKAVKLPTNKPIAKESLPEEGYEDIFNKAEDEIETTTVLSSSKLDENFLREAEKLLKDDFGLKIDTSEMSQEEIFADLEASLEAMSKLDELAEKNEVISRIYYPPPTLISYADKEGMQIGGSTCVVSMGTGRNIWFIPEIKRMQMWGKFYKDLDGNPQIEEFMALEEKDIESIDQLTDVLHRAFINIRKNNHIFLGLIDIEGNGFERNVFDELELPWEEIEKLMDIHIEKRNTTKFPQLASDSFIEVHYYGRSEVINFIDNQDSLGILEIAEDTRKLPEYEKGVISGIVCVDEEAAYFFILSDNFRNLDDPSSFEVDFETLSRMYDLIQNANLTPVSWFKIVFGFRSFETLPLWDELKDDPIFSLIKEKYDEYIEQLLKVKENEDRIKRKVEEEFRNLEKKI